MVGHIEVIETRLCGLVMEVGTYEVICRASLDVKSHSFIPLLFKNSRYKNGTTNTCSLMFSFIPCKAFAERPLPCNYNVIQLISALSQR
jgi:hypothetical protein